MRRFLIERNVYPQTPVRSLCTRLAAKMTTTCQPLFVQHRRCLLKQLSVCMIAASLTIFAIIGIPTIRHYSDTRQFVQTTCTVESSVFEDNSSVPCRHTESAHRGGLDHDSSYPCLTIKVDYMPRGSSGDGDRVTEAVLFKSYNSYTKSSSNKQVSISDTTK